MRVIIDGSFDDTIGYYDIFPVEPTIRPDSDIAIDLPIAKEDRLKPISLLGVLERLSAIKDKRVMLYCHGNEEGLVMGLVPGSRDHPNRDHLHLIRIFSEVVAAREAIDRLPADKQVQAWFERLKALKALDGTILLPDIEPKQSVASYKSLFNKLLDAAAKGWSNVSRAQLDQLIARRLEVKKKQFERIEIRGCQVGRSDRTLKALRAFFGCGQVVAPKTVVFDGTMTVIIDPKFERDLNRNVATRTRAARRAVKPVSMYGQLGRDLPPVRVNDVDPAPGNEVFIRFWATSLTPHNFGGWMVATGQAHLRTWIETYLSADSSKYRNGTRLPIHAFWLRDDQDNSIIRVPLNLDDNPLAPPPVQPVFAFPRDPEYRQHLVFNAAPAP